MIACGAVLLFGYWECCFRCCSGRNGSEYPWNGNYSSSDKSRIPKDLASQIADVNILERNSSNYGLEKRPRAELRAASRSTERLKKGDPVVWS